MNFLKFRDENKIHANFTDGNSILAKKYYNKNKGNYIIYPRV